jgi:hypothetical protein
VGAVSRLMVSPLMSGEKRSTQFGSTVDDGWRLAQLVVSLLLLLSPHIATCQPWNLRTVTASPQKGLSLHLVWRVWMGEDRDHMSGPPAFRKGTEGTVTPTVSKDHRNSFTQSSVRLRESQPGQEQ